MFEYVIIVQNSIHLRAFFFFEHLGGEVKRKLFRTRKKKTRRAKNAKKIPNRHANNRWVVHDSKEIWRIKNASAASHPANPKPHISDPTWRNQLA